MDYDEIHDLAHDLNRPVGTLYVLDQWNDPFYIGAPRYDRAKWFADLWHGLHIPIGWHYRRIHYFLISQEVPVGYFKGGSYQNFFEHWTELNGAARDAVHLGLVPLNAFVDRRNPDPIIYLRQPLDAVLDDIENVDGHLWHVAFTLPQLPKYGELHGGVVPQPYHVELWAEKSTMNDILIPLAQRYHCNLVTGVGETTATRCRELIDRIRNDEERPVRILYISDFDPAGMSMPVAAARKIEYELYRQGLIEEGAQGHDVQVRPIILNHDQCVEYRLPRTPIKETERRGARFEARFGEGATELDALEALHPGVFAEIVSAEIERYWNPDHDDEVKAQLDDVDEQLEDIKQEVHQEHQDDIDEFQSEIDALNQQLKEINKQAAELRERMKPEWQAMADKLRDREPDIEIECPEFDADEDPDPLFDSTREYVDQVDCYKDFQGKPKERKPRTARTRTGPLPMTRGN